jgi:hypothetical protein
MIKGNATSQTGEVCRPPTRLPPHQRRHLMQTIVVWRPLRPRSGDQNLWSGERRNRNRLSVTHAFRCSFLVSLVSRPFIRTAIATRIASMAYRGASSPNSRRGSASAHAAPEDASCQSGLEAGPSTGADSGAIRRMTLPAQDQCSNTASCIKLHGGLLRLSLPIIRPQPNGRLGLLLRVRLFPELLQPDATLVGRTYARKRTYRRLCGFPRRWLS